MSRQQCMPTPGDCDTRSIKNGTRRNSAVRSKLCAGNPSPEKRHSLVYSLEVELPGPQKSVK